MENRISGWIMIAGGRRTILARIFSFDESAGLRHCIRDVHLNRRSITDPNDVGQKRLKRRQRYWTVTCLFDNVAAIMRHLTI